MRIMYLCIALAGLLGSSVYASDQQQAAAPNATAAADVAIYAISGINPQNYPCAKEMLYKLYQNRSETMQLSNYHPQKIFTWVADLMQYYGAKIIDFFRGFFSKNTAETAIKNTLAFARDRSGNPLSGIDGWIYELSPRSQKVIADQVRFVVKLTTAPDGSCVADK